jgi:hypothetical protein
MSQFMTNGTYRFVGQCTDCTGSGTGVLMLKNFALGAPLNNSNFVSFTYTSNLTTLSMSASDLQSTGLTGTIPATLPGPATIQINKIGSGTVFQSNVPNGNWCAGSTCSADFGPTSTWTFVPDAPPSPVPTLSVPMLISLAGMLALTGAYLLKPRVSA